MDVKYVNPFMESFKTIMPQLGFGTIQKGRLEAKGKELVASGIVIIVGIVGAIKGNVVYTMNMEDAKKVVSKMMMGMPVTEIDAMAKSALSELANMLSANAATCFSNIGILVDISTPTLLQGNAVSIGMSSSHVLCLQLLADDIPIDINIAFEN